jgi:cob(I)alamin adenosyltransferase
MRIYTKTGDAGETGLFGGPRVSKDDARVEAYGEVDELNAALGAARARGLHPEIDQLLGAVQEQLFTVGAELATPAGAKAHSAVPAVSPDWIAALEIAIDRFQAELPPLRQFILPGGSAAGADLHLARAVCRRAERRVVALHRREPVAADVLSLLNRLSDFLFVAARLANHRARVPEVVWDPGKGSHAPA